MAEVQQMLGSNKVRTVAMSSTDGLRRGMKVVNTNEPIKITCREGQFWAWNFKTLNWLEPV